MAFSRQEYCSGLLFPSPGELPNPGIGPKSPALQVDSLPSEPPGKPKNTGVGSLSLLQGNFLTQELNWGLLKCRWILYQLSPLAAQFCPTLCSPRDYSPPGPCVHGILQARILEWVAMPSSRGSSPARDQTRISCTEADFLPLSHQGSLYGSVRAVSS